MQGRNALVSFFLRPRTGSHTYIQTLLIQVAQRVEDVWLMVSVKRTTLQRAASKPARPVQSVPPTTVPLLAQAPTEGVSLKILEEMPWLDIAIQYFSLLCPACI